MKTLILIAMAAVLVGCASVDQQRLDIWQSQSRQHSAAMVGTLEACESDLCRVVVARDLSDAAPRMPAREYHPAWSILANTVNAAVPLAGSYLVGGQWRRALRDVSAGYVDIAGQMAGMDRADYSTNVGGNYGDGWQEGDNDSSDHSQRGRRIDSDGDDYEAGGDIRITSPGPIDESGDCRDGGDCSAPEPPGP